MGLMDSINQYKQIIVIAGLVLGAVSTAGYLPSELLGLSEGTLKAIYTIIILLSGIVFVRFYRPKKRFVHRVPPGYKSSDKVGVPGKPISKEPVKKEEDVRVPPRDKRKIYEGF